MFKPAAAAGYKPAPQLGQQIAVFLTFVLHFTRLAVNLYQNKIYTYETLTFGQWRP